MMCTASLRCTLKHSQCGCALRNGLAVEQSLRLAQALSQEGFSSQKQQVEAYGVSWSDPSERRGCEGQEIAS